MFNKTAVFWVSGRLWKVVVHCTWRFDFCSIPEADTATFKSFTLFYSETRCFAHRFAR